MKTKINELKEKRIFNREKKIKECLCCGTEYYSPRKASKFCSIGCQRIGRNSIKDTDIYHRCVKCKKLIRDATWLSAYCSSCGGRN